MEFEMIAWAENDITNVGLKALLEEAYAPRQQPDGRWSFNGNLKKLELWSNRITCDGAKALADSILSARQNPDNSWVFNTTLEQLTLNANRIGEGGAVALCDAMAPHDNPKRVQVVNTTLRKLDVRGEHHTPPNWDFSSVVLVMGWN
jgi:hypothetical protein